MSDVTELLERIEAGDGRAAAELLPVVYDELRKLAAARMSHERSDHTLGATALVHEAYLRLVGGPVEASWQGSAHFFAAAAESMRRILVDHARAKGRDKRGGQAKKLELDEALLVREDRLDEVLAVDEALNELEKHDPQAAALVKLRFFAGFEHQRAADALQISRGAADRLWLLARTWLHRRLHDAEQ
jgi:RNA polymerase sigma factor (TIGR02999 family)